MSKYAEVGDKAWWGYVDSNWEKLLGIIKRYHPSYGRKYSKNVTAKAAEAARQDCVAEIEAEGPVDPEKAYKDRDADSIYNILSATWFGVPESTDCWGIEGFRELVIVCEGGVPSSSMEGLSENG